MPMRTGSIFLLSEWVLSLRMGSRILNPVLGMLKSRKVLDSMVSGFNPFEIDLSDGLELPFQMGSGT